MTPKVVDNDRDEITAELNGKEIRGWSYRDEQERRVKMRMAREFCEGWYQRDNYEPTEAELEAYLNLGGESGDARLARQMAEARKLK